MRDVKFICKDFVTGINHCTVCMRIICSLESLSGSSIDLLSIRFLLV